MTDDLQYFPVLRWKAAERKALQALSADVKSRITPLVEFVPKDFEEPARAAFPMDGSAVLFPHFEANLSSETILTILPRKVDQIVKCWGWKERIIVDFSLLGEERVAGAVPGFLRRAAQSRLTAVPTIGLHSDPAYV